MKPCIVCGEPSTTTRCPDHQIRRHREPDIRNSVRWTRLSKRLRKLQPWCLTCGATEDLTVDHRLPLHTHPDLAFDIDNLDVLCRPCNSTKGHKPLTRGNTPEEGHGGARGKAQEPLYTRGVSE